MPRTTPRTIRRKTWRTIRLAAVMLTLFVPGGCATWRPVDAGERWTLYVQDGDEVDAGRFRASLEPAFETVEDALGPFEAPVAIHAWDGGVRLEDGRRGQIQHGEDGIVQDVPGIGPAKVRAFHSRGAGSPFVPAGVFVGTADTGTAVHELVHARLAEIQPDLPMWLEEGLATLLGDGVEDEGRWIVDGFACWPWRELREAELSDAELERLISIQPEDGFTVRDNVLVHFVGWAVAFDLYREHGDFDAHGWLLGMQGNVLWEARRRLDATLDRDTPLDWIDVRLRDEDRGVRVAVVKGTWKMRSRAVLELLLERLEYEQDAEVRVGIAINALATAGEVRLGPQLWDRMWTNVMPILAETELSDREEQRALRRLHAAYASRGSESDQSPEGAMFELARFWEE